MTDTENWNTSIIDEFRANDGKVGGMFEGATMLLLKSTGARTGAARTNPLIYLADGDRFLIFASKAGADSNPDWYYNLLAHPTVEIELGTDTMTVEATILDGPERDELFRRQAEVRPQFGEYQKKTTRRIPVIALERTS